MIFEEASVRAQTKVMGQGSFMSIEVGGCFDSEEVLTVMPRFVVTHGADKGNIFTFEHDITFVGRSRRNDIKLTDPKVSGKHFKVFRIGRKFFVEDLRSTNGTLVNGQRVEAGEGFELGEGDRIRLGRTVLRIESLPAPDLIPPATALERNENFPAPETESDPNRRQESDHGLRLIQDVTRLFKQSFNFHSFCRKVLDFILESLPRIDTAALVYLHPATQNRLENKTIVLQSRPEFKNLPGNVVDEKIIDRMLQAREPVQVLNAARDREDQPEDDVTLQVRSVLCIPLISDSVLRGALYVHSTTNPCGFRKEDVTALNTLSVSLAVAFEKAMLSRRPRGPLAGAR